MITQTMKLLLEKISKLSIEFEVLKGQGKLITGNWLGYLPATENEIIDAEIRLGVKFPKDYREFLLITNGFIGPNDVEPSFEMLCNINYLHKINPEIFDYYEMPELKNAIVVAGILEEQQFFLIPPDLNNSRWKYWKFANWIPGEYEFESLNSYFENVLEFLQDINNN